MEAGTDVLVDEGRRALIAGDWATARSCFERAQAIEEDRADVLDGLGRALHFQGDYARAIELSERAFAGYRELGRVVEAADTARWLAFLHAAINANMAAAGGWMERAGSILEEQDECAGHGWLFVDTAAFTEDAREREKLASSALAIARRFGDTDLEYDALALLGEARVATGDVAGGMKLLDQAMTAVTSGEVAEAVPVSDILCRLLSACEGAVDVTRAEDWMRLAGAFEHWSEFVSPICRSHYGGLLVAVGRWEEAEAELLAALSIFERSYRGIAGFALTRLAELRVRQGRLDEAVRLLGDHDHDPDARRALAAVALARGETALAEDMVRLCLAGDEPPDAQCAPALDLLVQVRLARADAAAAAESAAQLAGIAAASRDQRVAAFADMAAGRVHAHEGDDRATGCLQAALAAFAGLGLPLEAARARLELARAIAGAAPEAAEREARQALGAFERLGAAYDADGAAALLRELGSRDGRAWPKRYGPLTKRETEVLSLLATGCSNADIGSRLFISTRTAEHHVASILSKLGLKTRAEAAAYAVRELPKDR